MSQVKRSVEPELTNAERDELGHLHYLDTRLDELRARGLITPDAYATVVAENQGRRELIELSGSYRNALTQANKLAEKDLREALKWAECARLMDPERGEAWDQIVALHWKVGDYDGAIAECALAAERLPRFHAEKERLERARVQRLEEDRLKAERARQDGEIKGWMAQAERALADGRDAEAIALCEQILSIRPEHVGALATSAFALQRNRQLELALGHYRTLCELQPANQTWPQWVRNVQLRRNAERVTGTAPESAAARGAAPITSAPPPISWSSFAGEFLKEHAQELLLTLAVLLIVVSSTVGAHLLLGDLLWSPVGKCTLALVATLLFAVFGAGLLRWGASRAGRMMLIATLIVVPIHFMLVGEMKLLHDPTAIRLTFLVIEAVALLAMVRWVSGMLASPAGARLLTASLLLLSAGSATTARGSPLAWELQFASFQLSPLVFLGAVWALGARRWGETSKEQRELVYMMLGLLGFALVACLVRTGVYALRLEASLYALPVMLIATAGVHSARKLAADEPDHERLALVRFAGFGLSGLAFALALASSPDATALSSANILAVSLIGAALYVASLRTDRHPAFLYLAVGAVAAGRLGAQYFLAERLHAIEDAVRQLLGYPDRLPVPFRAILGVGPNLVLAALALWFVKHWKDQTLARHCHFIGLPLSVAACVWSGFEPLAAVICLSLYAILYLLAIRIFAAPWLSYLAAAAIAGACYFATELMPGITLADQALVAAMLGFAFWATRVELRRRQAAPAYHVPWAQAGLALTGVAMFAASWHLVTAGVGSWTGAGAFGVIAVLAFLLNRERPRAVWAYLALLSFVEFTICGLGLAQGVRNLEGCQYGLLFIADGLLMLAAAEGLRYWLNPRAPQVDEKAGDMANSHWVGTVLEAIPASAIVLTFVADWFGLLDLPYTWRAGLVLLLGSGPLLWATRLLRHPALVYLGLAQVVAGSLDLVSCAVGWDNETMLAGWLAVSAAILAFAIWAVGAAARRMELSKFYVEPCFHFAFLLMVGTYFGALMARGLGREAYPLATAALGLNVLVTMLLGRTWGEAKLTYAAVVHMVTATYVVIFSVGENDPEMAFVLGLAAVLEAIVLCGIGLLCQSIRDAWAIQCARPLFHWAVLLTVAAVLLSDRSSLVLALVGVSFLLTVKCMPAAEWLYAAVAAFLAACYFRWLIQVPPVELLALATLAAFVLWCLGVVIQRNKPAVCERLGLHSLAYEYSLFHSAMIVALIAVAVRVDLSLAHQTTWTAHYWFPFSLAILSLAMLRAYPRRACVHASLAFLTWSVVAAIVPSLTSACFVSLAGSSLAIGLLLTERFIRPREHALCARLGVIDADYSPVVRGWALAVFGLTASLAILVVAGEMSAAMLGRYPAAVALTAVDWWVMLLTIGLIAIFLIALAGESDGWGSLESTHLVVALQWTGVVVLWWLGVGCSPLAGRFLAAGAYYPLATVVAALATARVVMRHTHSESWHELAWLGDLRSESMERLLSIQACVLMGLALVFTRGAIEPSTAITLVLASVTMAMVEMATGWRGTVYAGSIAWSAGLGVSCLVIAQRLGWSPAGVPATFASAGVLTAAFTLIALAGWLRRDPSVLKGQSSWAAGSDASHGLRPPWPMEIVAFASSLFAVVTVLAAAASTPALGGWTTTAGVGVILAAGFLQILLVPRWRAEWLVYVAQTVMLAAYVDYRLAFPQPLAFDAIVFTLLGYLDLGIAEVLERLELETYARPARFFSLLVPSLPLLQFLIGGRLDELGLFHLMAAGTFYGIACGRLRWKTLGYAAAVLYNAALWVLWSRLGWELSSHPQFFLVPVGLSTILFAEVNRRELGRANVNTIRAVGLTIIYLSLAFPMWHFESFGAWVTLLLASLAGVFIGIGLRLQTFLWMGLATFVFDVLYEMGRVSLDHARAKWAIMLALGIALMIFVALNEKKRIVGTMRLFFDQARTWE